MKVLDSTWKGPNRRKTQFSNVIRQISSNLGNTRENSRKYPGMKIWYPDIPETRVLKNPGNYRTLAEKVLIFAKLHSDPSNVDRNLLCDFLFQEQLYFIFG